MTKRRNRNQRRNSPRRARHSNAMKYIVMLVVGVVLGVLGVYACTKYGKRQQRTLRPIETADTTLTDTAPTATDARRETPLLDVAVPADVPAVTLDYEGFKVSFNPEAHQPNWVAWELTADESRADACKRSDAAFAPDERVEGCASLDDYRGSGYDRGHMAPAGDMKWSLDAMTDCFLLTNMCPQRQELNSGAWNKLEEKCRQWALRDSAIVIVCGPVLTDRLTQTIGQVPVPERFFKVVLAPYADPPRGIGFIMPNGKVPGGMQAAAVSIDQVEEITGYDFFAILDDDIECAVESECNFPKWSRK